ncbi:type 1 glutamine amidotransferase [Craterilacuibacter sp.]|uniref:type 1 glutamine amidotransferase n=1 Tax=Craterilacuibacter sp. TaxID=2870909 RepID=UPI003F67C98A
MKPVAIFQHYPGEGAGYFAEFAERVHLKTRLFQGYEGQALPESCRDYAGLVVMGGPMSVRDRLPFVEAEKRLIAEAVALDIPVIGHCLGGQLLAEVLGGEVITNAGGSEIGWHPLQASTPAATHWFGAADGVEVFHWHSENFTLPAGAQLLLASAHCPHQAFSHGIHLGMQFHIEMTSSMLEHWSECEDELAPHLGKPGVQEALELKGNATQRVLASNALAEHAYHKWVQALKT